LESVAAVVILSLSVVAFLIHGAARMPRHHAPPPAPPRTVHRWRPEYVYGFFAFVVALTVTLAFYLLLDRMHHKPELNVWTVLGMWLVGVNPTAFGFYGFDKARARGNAGRVPESVLHGLALAGGSIGAYLGMRVFRHKTIKGTFRAFYFLIVLVQAVLIGLIIYVLLRR
jgi:uncharacterized membrane protein YsdA (DUF1294 family)